MTAKTFGSDNFAPVHPRIFEELIRINRGDAEPYGEDRYSAQAVEILQQNHLLGPNCDVRFMLNGTGTNVVALSALLKPWESVICAESAHINCDEVGAPEYVASIKLVPIPTDDGKLTPALVEPHLSVLGFEHARQPKVISISNSTEYGTVYTPQELKNLCDFAHSHGLRVHCDGARIANAVASQESEGVTLFDLSAGAGLDALSLGGTKNGMMSGEALVLFGDAAQAQVFMLRKMSLQLASKMRYVSAQFSAFFSDDTWLECARNANNQAAILSLGLSELGLRLTRKTSANEVFVILPKSIIKPLQKQFGFYDWDSKAGEVRFVTSWDTESKEVELLLSEIKKALEAL